jgi:hypothetical protein
MARKTLRYTVADAGRDSGKVFVLTEMPASQAERWGTRALMGMVKGGAQVPDEFVEIGGMAGLAAMAGLGRRMIAFIASAFASMPFDLAEPLLDEMMGCVQSQPNPADPRITRVLTESDIEEVQTRLKLRAEVLKLHLDFLPAAAPQEPIPATATRA